MTDSPYIRIKFLPPNKTQHDDTFLVDSPDKTIQPIDIQTALSIYSHPYLTLLKSYSNQWLKTTVGAPGCSASP